MVRFRSVIVLASLAAALANSATMQASNPVDVLLIDVYDDGAGNSLYDADYYANRSGSPPMCTGGPSEEYCWAATGLSVPETCATGQPASLLLATPAVAQKSVPRSTIDRPLRAKMAPAASYTETLNTFTYIDGSGVAHARIDPVPGFTNRRPESYAKLKLTSGDTIPVKIFAVKWESARTNLHPFLPAAVVRDKILFAVEIASLPAGVTAPVITPTQSATNPKNYSGSFVDPNATTEKVFVVTQTKLFP